MTDTMRIPVGELVYAKEAFPRICPTCRTELTTAVGAVVEHGIYNTHIVSLVDRSNPKAERLCCSVDELTEIGPDLDGVVHASPEDVAAAVDAGWLPPGAEFYGCHFRIATTKCRACERPALGCSWVQNPAAGKGDCCADCHH